MTFHIHELHQKTKREILEVWEVALEHMAAQDRKIKLYEQLSSVHYKHIINCFGNEPIVSDSVLLVKKDKYNAMVEELNELSQKINKEYKSNELQKDPLCEEEVR